MPNDRTPAVPRMGVRDRRSRRVALGAGNVEFRVRQATKSPENPLGGMGVRVHVTLGGEGPERER